MANFTVIGNTDWSSYDDMAGGTIDAHNAHVFKYTSATGFKVTLQGSGFRYDAQGIPIGGTITELTVIKGGELLATYTALSTALTDFCTLALGQTSGASHTEPDVTALFIEMRSGDDLIKGNELGKSISGYDGNDTIFGNGGDDWLSGGRGVDSYFGGTGFNGIYFDDVILAEHGARINLALTTGNILDDGFGNTETAAQIQNAEGTTFADKFIGSNGDNQFIGQGGKDTLYGAGGDDALQGGTGIDSFYGGDGTDMLTFYDVDTGVSVNLNKPLGNQILNDGFGNSERASGIENIVGSIGQDTLTGSNTSNVLWGSSGNDILSGLGNSDSLYGESGHDKIYGGDGDDVMHGGEGRDTIYGGNGIDDMVFWTDGGAGHGAKVNLSLSTGQVLDDGFGNVETATSIEYLEGTDYGDSFTGNALTNVFWGLDGNDAMAGVDGNDDLYGGNGNDQLFGGNGTDYIVGGNGIDVLTGGADADSFSFMGDQPGSDGVDRITDFSATSDNVLINVHWANDLVLGQLIAAEFRSAAGATTATTAAQRVIYNTTTGNLYFDADGVGGQAATLILTLSNHAALTFSHVYTVEPF